MSKTKAQLETELRSLRANLAKAHRQAAELSDRIGNLEAGMADRNGKITRLHDERDAAIKERDELTAQRDEYAAQLVGKGAAVSFLEGQLAAVEANLKSYSDQLVSAEVRARSAKACANYWELRAKEAERPWWCRVWDRVRRNGGAR